MIIVINFNQKEEVSQRKKMLLCKNVEVISIEKEILKDIDIAVVLDRIIQFLPNFNRILLRINVFVPIV